MNILKVKNFLRFLITFLLVFAICYFGTIVVIGLSAPGKYYSHFVDQWLDFVSGIKISLMKGAAIIASLFGYTTVELPNYLLRVLNGRGVLIAEDCVGYGVMSFWIAFVMASHGRHWKNKIYWILFGLLLLWLINVIRIGLFLVAINKGWPLPLGLDHHSWFNIVAYGIIFLLIWRFEASRPSERQSRAGKESNGTQSTQG